MCLKVEHVFAVVTGVEISSSLLTGFMFKTFQIAPHPLWHSVIGLKYFSETLKVASLV
jgi:hypothetical protein